VKVTVWDMYGNRDSAISAGTAGNIATSTDPLIIGARADTTLKWDGLLAGVFIAKELYTDEEIEWQMRTGLTAGRQAYTEHVLGGASNQCNSVCMSEDGNLLLVATGDGNPGVITYWRYRWNHKDRADLQIDAGVHTSVAVLSNVMVGSTVTNRAYESPYHDVFLFDYGTFADDYNEQFDRNTYLRGSTQVYAYYRQSDGKIVFLVGDTTLVSSALATWNQGDIIPLTFRYGFDNGLQIWRNRVSIGSSATYDGFHAYRDLPSTDDGPAWWFGMNYDRSYPAGRIYDFRYWPVELTDAQVAVIERGRGEAPFAWTQAKDCKVFNRSNERGRSEIVFGNIPGDIPAGLRMIYTIGNDYEWFIGLRGLDATHFQTYYDAEDYEYIEAAHTVVTGDPTTISGNKVLITPATTDNIRRVDIRLQRDYIEWLRHFGRFRLLARVYETGTTPCCKVQFAGMVIDRLW